ncbi:hypothetical protein EVAR_90731_1 [Eumeta japonica]|uniref:Uncharacterized protein n=1 Tax=Eumeta variegata TaxID=151549 RepID=A0A4C2A192_EUMVA|nr:hypothetical protein EVAR_90731_1 [Eumeta japonica]
MKVFVYLDNLLTNDGKYYKDIERILNEDNKVNLALQAIMNGKRVSRWKATSAASRPPPRPARPGARELKAANTLAVFTRADGGHVLIPKNTVKGVKEMSLITTASALFDLKLPLWALLIVQLDKDGTRPMSYVNW